MPRLVHGLFRGPQADKQGALLRTCPTSGLSRRLCQLVGSSSYGAPLSALCVTGWQAYGWIVSYQGPELPRTWLYPVIMTSDAEIIHTAGLDSLVRC